MQDINTICLPGPGQSLAITAPAQVIPGLTDAQCRVVAELPPQLPHAQRRAVIQAFRRLNEG
jgi:hypothetical protein